MNWPTLENNYSVTVARIRDGIDLARKNDRGAASHLRWFTMDCEVYPICGPHTKLEDTFHVSLPLWLAQPDVCHDCLEIFAEDFEATLEFTS